MRWADRTGKVGERLVGQFCDIAFEHKGVSQLFLHGGEYILLPTTRGGVLCEMAVITTSH